MAKHRKRRNRLNQLKENRASRRIPVEGVLAGKVKISDTDRELVHAAMELHAAQESPGGEDLDNFLIQAFEDKLSALANEISPEAAVGLLAAAHIQKGINLPIEFSAKEIGLSPSDYEVFITGLENRVEKDPLMKDALELLTCAPAKAEET